MCLIISQSQFISTVTSKYLEIIFLSYFPFLVYHIHENYLITWISLWFIYLWRNWSGESTSSSRNVCLAWWDICSLPDMEYSVPIWFTEENEMQNKQGKGSRGDKIWDICECASCPCSEPPNGALKFILMLQSVLPPSLPRNSSLCQEHKMRGERFPLSRQGWLGQKWDRNLTEMRQKYGIRWCRVKISSLGLWGALAKTGNSDFYQECREWPRAQEYQDRETGAGGSFKYFKSKISINIQNN